MDKRLTDRMANYWDRLKKEDPLPQIEVFNPGPIQDIWPNCIRIQVQEAGARSYYFDYMGDAIAKILGKNFTGERVLANMLKSPKFKLISHLDELMDEPKVLIDEGQFINDKNKVVKYRSCILPFGKAVDQVSHFVIGVSWREF